MDNSCVAYAQQLGESFRSLVYYSHLIPVAIGAILIFFIIRKSNHPIIKSIFSLFIVFFCLWLLGDLLIYISPDYNLIAFAWAPLDYINILVFIFGAYFLMVITSEKDIRIWHKIVLLMLAAPAWWITTTNQSVLGFNVAYCNAENNSFLTGYKLFVEVVITGFIMFYSLFKARGSSSVKVKKIVIVVLALVFFFGIFSVTEYISSQTGNYYVNLYSLFILPIFLLAITYSIIDLNIFEARLIGFQLPAYILIIMVGSQFFFLENTTYKALTTLTFILSLGFGGLLLRSGKREEAAREKVENLAIELENANVQLKEIDRQKDELVSIVSHQMATPVTSIKWYIEMMLDGDLGTLTEQQKKHVKTMQTIASNLTELVSLILDVSRIDLRKMKINRDQIDLGKLFKDILDVIRPKAEEKGLALHVSVPENLPTALLDKKYTRMTIENLLSNAVKYTQSGSVSLKVEISNGNRLLCQVSDTGCGIPRSEQSRIFSKLFRASNVRTTVDGNGFGLYIAKGAIENQGGRIWFTSEEGKGSTFSIDLPLSKS